MVQNDIEHNLYALRLRAVNKIFEVCICSPVRVNGQEVVNPIAVVRSAISLNPLLLERRGDPDCCEAKLLDSSNTLTSGAATG